VKTRPPLPLQTSDWPRKPRLKMKVVFRLQLSITTTT
jgi:hypothetical protein